MFASNAGRISSITYDLYDNRGDISVRRPSNRPRREDRICLRAWGQSIDNTGFRILSVTSDRLNHADAYCYKTFRCNQKYRYGLLHAFRRSISLSVRVSVAGKSSLQPRYHDSYRDGSCYLPARVTSGTTATHDLCIDCPGLSEPAPVFGDYVPYSHQQCVQNNIFCHPGSH